MVNLGIAILIWLSTALKYSSMSSLPCNAFSKRFQRRSISFPSSLLFSLKLQKDAFIGFWVGIPSNESGAFALMSNTSFIFLIISTRFFITRLMMLNTVNGSISLKSEPSPSCKNLISLSRSKFS